MKVGGSHAKPKLWKPTMWREMTFYERQAIQDKVDRTVKRTTSYLKSAERFLHMGIGMPPSVWYWDLAEQAIGTATEVVEALPDHYFQTEELQDYFGLMDEMKERLGDDWDPGPNTYNVSDDLLEKARALVAAIEKRREHEKILRRIRALENTTGRTPEEAEQYKAAAAKLREKL
jgi:hypothetical protein